MTSYNATVNYNAPINYNGQELESIETIIVFHQPRVIIVEAEERARNIRREKKEIPVDIDYRLLSVRREIRTLYE